MTIGNVRALGEVLRLIAALNRRLETVEQQLDTIRHEQARQQETRR